jgi:excisionase family DNA binding protein
MFEDYPEIMTVDQLCEALLIGRNKAYDLLMTNQIKAVRCSGWKIPRAAVEEYIVRNSHLDIHNDPFHTHEKELSSR